MCDIYLDNNATTRLDDAVLGAMLPFLTEYYGNPSSIHGHAKPVAAALEVAREQVQTLIGAEFSSEIIFTSCASESTSTAILSAVEAMPDRKEIITSVVEHPATLMVCQQLERKGYKVHWIGVDKQGNLDSKAYRAALSEQVAVVSLMWANNETGTLFPIRQLAQWAKAYGILFHTDAVQVSGRIPLEVKFSNIDMLSLSAHKFHGPKGIGALYLKRGTRFRPLLRGGHQERGRRAGTENVSGIIGLGQAAAIAHEMLQHDIPRIARLRDRLEQGILQNIPNSFVNGNPLARVANTSNIAFEYIEGEAILLLLNKVGIAASSGSACTSGSLEPSHVMRAMGVPQTAAHGSIRFSLSRYTRDGDIDTVLEALPPIIERLRQLSPYWGVNGPNADAFQPAFA